jgi:Rrf2 family protein
MKLSAGVEWALHCCVVLSQSPDPVPAARLAEYHGVSPTYLAKQLQALTRAGVTQSIQGHVGGGYTLTRDASEISVLQVIEAIDGDQSVFRCTEIRQQGAIPAPPSTCVTPCAIARAMYRAEDAWRDALAATSIAEIAADVTSDTHGTAFPRLRKWLAATGA